METIAKPKHSRKHARKPAKSIERDSKGHWIKPSFILQYEEAFKHHYPTYTPVTRPIRNIHGDIDYLVMLNGDSGQRPLSETDIREATRAFRK